MSKLLACVLSIAAVDVAAVIEKLGHARADVVGYSFGADCGLRAAIQHPERVRRLVVISTAFEKSGWYPEAQEGIGEVDVKMVDSFKDWPTGKLSQSWPEPERFPQFLTKMGAMMKKDYDWSADVKKLPMPVMLVFADHDSVLAGDRAADREILERPDDRHRPGPPAVAGH